MDNKWGFLVEKMKARLAYLNELIDRDYNGGLSTALGEWRELKYWIEAIERGEFD